MLPEGKKTAPGIQQDADARCARQRVQGLLVGQSPPFPEEDLEQRKEDLLSFLLG
jgi:hypothetical protein